MKKKLIRPTEMTEDEKLINQLTITVESLLQKINLNLGPTLNTPLVLKLIRKGNARLGHTSWYESEVKQLKAEAKKYGKPVGRSTIMWSDGTLRNLSIIPPA